MSTRPAQVVQKSLSTFDKSIFDKDIKISGIAINAAQVKKGDIFVALAGTKLMVQILLLKQFKTVR